jgi:hypothetical protein
MRNSGWQRAACSHAETRKKAGTVCCAARRELASSGAGGCVSQWTRTAIRRLAMTACGRECNDRPHPGMQWFRRAALRAVPGVVRLKGVGIDRSAVALKPLRAVPGAYRAAVALKPPRRRVPDIDFVPRSRAS